jgi:uncharacterized protein YdbL (DUF1318 family)
MVKRSVTLIGVAVGLSGCITAPDIVVRDRATALEEQAGGRYRDLSQALRAKVLRPEPHPLTSEQIQAASPGDNNATFGEIVRWAEFGQDHHALIERWLMAGCVAEGADGLLRSTPGECTLAVDDAGLSQAVSEENRNRRQLWRALAAAQDGSSEDEVARQWRQKQVELAPCGAWVEVEQGKFEPKRCPE